MKLKTILKKTGDFIAGKSIPVGATGPTGVAGVTGPTGPAGGSINWRQFLKAGPVDPPKRRFIMRRRRVGKLRGYRTRLQLIDVFTKKRVSYREARLRSIRQSQLQGLAVAAARREAQLADRKARVAGQSAEAMLDFKLRFFPLCRHDAPTTAAA